MVNNMAKVTTVLIDLPEAQQIVNTFGLGKGGMAQYHLTNLIKTVADPYVPMGVGNLKNQSPIVDDGTAIHYTMPYARVHWYGEIMVDPVLGVGGIFMGEDVGWRSRKGVKKIPASKSSARPPHLPDNFNYNGSPMRGSQWTIRAYADNKDAILKSVEDFILKNS